MFVAAALGSAVLASGAPKLRLSTAAAGPFSIAEGQNGATQTIDAFNAGDGDLALSVSSSAEWLVPQVGETRGCIQPGGRCTVIRFGLQTSGLPKGIVTGFVTVSDPNAVDAPQTISVTVQIGGGVPDSVRMYVPPNGSQVRKTFTTSTNFQASASISGGPRLSVLGSGGGSFRTIYSYDIVAVADPGTQEGEYGGSMNVSGSSLAADNRSVPVQVFVTSKGIAVPTEERLRFRAPAGGSGEQVRSVFLNNGGENAFTIGEVTVEAGNDVAWLSAAADGGWIHVTVKPEGLALGAFEGKVFVASDAINDRLEIPVTLQVVDAGPPTISFDGVLTSLGLEPGTLALGDLATIRGEFFTNGVTDKTPEGEAWPGSRAGAAVFLGGRELPIALASFGQIDVQIPFDAVEGENLVQVLRDGQAGNSVAVQIVRSRPRIFWASNGDGVIVSTAGGGPSAGVLAGSTISLIGAGFGPPVIPVQAGTPAPVDATVDPLPLLRFGGSLFNPAPEITPSFAGLAPGTIGLYQIIVTIPEDAQRGENVPVSVSGARDPIFLRIE